MKPRIVVAGLLGLFLAGEARAGRFIAVPFAETMAPGRYSLWQYGLYEQKSKVQQWRSLNRLDLGLYEGAELGVFVISPKNRQPDTWVNLQYRPIAEGRYYPAVSVGIWDAFRKAPLFSDKPVGPSPFIAVSKSVTDGPRYAKVGLNFGANRLDGLSGGVDLRFLAGTGAMVEFEPKNLRLPGTDAWDFAVYQWIGKYFRVRASRMGGNYMLDAFFTYMFGPAPK